MTTARGVLVGAAREVLEGIAWVCVWTVTRPGRYWAEIGLILLYSAIALGIGLALGVVLHGGVGA